LDFLDARIQPQRFLGKVSPLRPAYIEGHEIRGDVRNADRRAHAAHDTIHKHLGHALEIPEDGLPDAFTHIDTLRAGLSAGIAIPAERRLRIEIEEVLFRILERLDVIGGLPSREGRHHRDRHAVLHRHLASQTGPYFGIVLGPIVGRAGAAKPAKAAGPTDDLLARIPQGLHDRDPLRHLVLLTGDLDGDHLVPDDFRLIDDVAVFLCHCFKNPLSALSLRTSHWLTADGSSMQSHPRSHSKSGWDASPWTPLHHQDDSIRRHRPASPGQRVTRLKSWLHCRPCPWRSWQSAPPNPCPESVGPRPAPSTKPDRNDSRDC